MKRKKQFALLEKNGVRAEVGMLKSSVNPSIISPGVNSLTELTGIWWVAYTKPRFEKAFARDLYNRGIGYFLPMREKTAVYDGRKRRVMLPLFTSYVFFCGTENDRYTAMTTNRVCHTIEVAAQDRLIDELATIEKALANNAVIDSYPGLPPGKRCMITAGPMAGVQGVIVEQRSAKARMVIEVEALGQGALLEIDSGLLEAFEY